MKHLLRKYGLIAMIRQPCIAASIYAWSERRIMIGRCVFSGDQLGGTVPGAALDPAGLLDIRRDLAPESLTAGTQHG